MNFKKHAILVSHVGQCCYVDAFHISSIVSWEVTQCHHMDPSQTRIHGLSKARIQATKNNSSFRKKEQNDRRPLDTWWREGRAGRQM